MDARLAALEARVRMTNPRSFLIMPWDLMPDASDDDMVIYVTFVRPTDQPNGESVPYKRTGIHPSEDNPGSENAVLYRDSAAAQPWTHRMLSNGSALIMPHNGREPLGGDHA